MEAASAILNPAGAEAAISAAIAADDPNTGDGPRRPERLPDAVPRGQRRPLPDRPAQAAGRARRVPRQVGRRDGLGHPRDGRPRGAGHRPGRRHRTRDERREPARRPAVRAQGDDPRLGQCAHQLAADGGQPALGGRARPRPLHRARRAVRGRRSHRRCDARGGRPDRLRGDHRPRPAGDVRPRHPADARGPAGPDPDPLQHRAARLRPVRDRAGRRPGRPPRRSPAPRLGGRDATVPAGRPADDLGAGAGRRAARAAPRRGRRAPDGPWRGGRHPGRCGPGRGERRHGQQGRHVHAGRPRRPTRHPVLRLRADQHGGPRHGRRFRHRDRGTSRRGGPRDPRRPHRAARHGSPQPVVRRHPGRADHRHRHRGRRRPRPVRDRPARGGRECGGPLGVDARLSRLPSGRPRAGTGRGRRPPFPNRWRTDGLGRASGDAAAWS